MGHIYDLLIIGGGINGAAIARDAAGRGLSVLLCERDDLASHTSSASTKLIHGGLRYLEYYEFRLVREALKEREVLLRAAPHIIWPMRFVLPYDKGLRPAWMLRLGLFLYDRLGGRKLLPGTTVTKFKKYPLKDVLEPRFKFGYEYSDCWVEDSRLVCLNAMQAQEKGADIRTRTEVTALETDGKLYAATINPKAGKSTKVQAKGVINAAGPWVEQMLGKIKTHDPDDAGLRLIKGSHIVTRKLFEGDQSYIFQNADNRIIFAIPYETDFTLIGTTDVPYDHSEGPVKISDAEITYLCNATNEYFQDDIAPSDVVWTYSGVRPLYDDKSEDASAVTRDYVLDVDTFGGERPLMSIYGGKITTSRKLAEHAMEKLSEYYPDMGEAWTREAALPGGDQIKNADFESFFADCVTQYSWASRKVLRRLARAYGYRLHEILDGVETVEGLGEIFDGGLSAAEIQYLVDHEFVRAVDDILWRRSKLGLHMNADDQARLTTWFAKTYLKL